MTLTLAEIGKDNVRAACKLTVEPHQETYVAPVMHSLAMAYAYGDVTWPRLVLDDDTIVAFVMGAFDPAETVEYRRCGIWRLNVAAGKQGRGYGRFAVESVLGEARRRGERRASVSWVPGEHSPEEFYLKLGFRKTGQIYDGEVVGAIDL